MLSKFNNNLTNIECFYYLLFNHDILVVNIINLKLMIR